MTQTEHTLDRIFFALSDRTRRGMLARLCEGKASIGELGTPYAMSAPAITKHVRVLEDAGLIQREVTGRVHSCSLTATGMKTAEEWLNFHRRFWEERLDVFENLLRAQSNGSKETDR